MSDNPRWPACLSDDEFAALVDHLAQNNPTFAGALVDLLALDAAELITEETAELEGAVNG